MTGRLFQSDQYGLGWMLGSSEAPSKRPKKPPISLSVFAVGGLGATLDSTLEGTLEGTFSLVEGSLEGAFAFTDGSFRSTRVQCVDCRLLACLLVGLEVSSLLVLMESSTVEALGVGTLTGG